MGGSRGEWGEEGAEVAIGISLQILVHPSRSNWTTRVGMLLEGGSYRALCEIVKYVDD